MNAQTEFTTQTHIYGTCPQCQNKYRVSKEGRIYEHGQCWGGYDYPLETSAQSLESSLENLTRKHKGRLERQANGESLTSEELEKLRTRPLLISSYQKRIIDWKPGKLEHREVQVKKRKKAAPTIRKTCCICGRSVKLRKDGNISAHSNKGIYNCQGSDRPPIEHSSEQCHEIRKNLANEIATARLYISEGIARKPKHFLDQIDENRNILLSTENLLTEHGYKVPPVIINCLFLENGDGEKKPRATGEDWTISRIETDTIFIAPDMNDFKGISVVYEPYRPSVSQDPIIKESKKRGFWNRLFGF